MVKTVTPQPKVKKTLLMEADAKKALSEKQPRKLTNLSPGAQADRAMKDHMGAMSHEEKYGIKIDGLTMHARIVQDKRMVRDKLAHIAFGPSYWKGLRDTYSASHCVKKLLVKPEGKSARHPS
eukprot:1258527-Amphidinium_carterae.1